MGGRYAAVDTIDQLRAMPWSEQSPLRCGVCVGVGVGVCVCVEGAHSLGAHSPASNLPWTLVDLV